MRCVLFLYRFKKWDILPPAELTDLLTRAQNIGFDELYLPYLYLWDTRDHVAALCRDRGIGLIVGVPVLSKDTNIPNFRDWRGNPGRKSPFGWTGVPHFLATETFAEMERQSEYWASQLPWDGIQSHLLAGIDYYGYPDTLKPNRADGHRNRYWAFDPVMLKDYATYLEARFHTIEQFNATYDTKHESFEKVRPASDPNDDTHGVTYPWYAGIMDRFESEALCFLDLYFGRLHTHMGLDRGRAMYYYALGRVGRELGQHEALEPLVGSGVEIWHTCNSVYVPKFSGDAPLDLARYAYRVGGKTLVGAGMYDGLVDRQNGVRAVRDGHGGILCRLDPHEVRDKDRCAKMKAAITKMREVAAHRQ